MKCELCGREILYGNHSEHHLTPKSRGGIHGPKILLHKVCHEQIHALFNVRELELYYNTLGKLKAHKDVVRFVKWIRKKDAGFNSKVRRTVK